MCQYFKKMRPSPPPIQPKVDEKQLNSHGLAAMIVNKYLIKPKTYIIKNESIILIAT